MLENQVETKLEETQLSIEQLSLQKKALKSENEVLSSKLEKLRRVSLRLPELQNEIETLRESKT